jgi:hypothetical protein
VFPFATLNPNAGARYHSDVLLIPSTNPRNIDLTNSDYAHILSVLPVFDSCVQLQPAPNNTLHAPILGDPPA